MSTLAPPVLTPQALDAVCDLVNDLCGIYLDESKGYLIEGRLSDVVKQHGCESYLHLVEKARQNLSPQLKTDIVNAITTNETLWFRDSTPFEALRYKILPELIDAKASSVYPKRLRIWSAACSTGQEVYSIAMAFADIMPRIQDWDLQIVGTDISPAAVEKAKQGVYGNLEISRGLDHEHRNAYFTPRGEQWEVSDVLKSKCQFEVRNLLEPFTSLGQFDIIFCRNVAIYFTPEKRKDLFLRLGQSLNPGGWLFTGSSESLIEYGPQFKPFQHCRAVCYQPNPVRM